MAQENTEVRPDSRVLDYRDQSRRAWGSPSNSSARESLMLGATLRIADALECMARNNNTLIERLADTEQSRVIAVNKLISSSKKLTASREKVKQLNKDISRLESDKNLLIRDLVDADDMLNDVIARTSDPVLSKVCLNIKTVLTRNSNLW